MNELVTGEFSDVCHEKAKIFKRKNTDDPAMPIVSFITIDSSLN